MKVLCDVRTVRIGLLAPKHLVAFGGLHFWLRLHYKGAAPLSSGRIFIFLSRNLRWSRKTQPFTDPAVICIKDLLASM